MDKSLKKKKYKTLFSDTVAFTISNFASKILVFLLIPLYTSVLSTKDYGIADLITNTINVLYPILTLCIMEATLRFAFDKSENKEEVLINSLIVVIASEILLILAMPIVQIISKQLYSYWCWFCFMYFGFNLQQIFSQYVKGIGKTKVFAISGVIQTLIVISINIIGLLIFKFGLYAYLLAISFGYYFASLYMVFAAHIKITYIRLNKDLLKRMLQFSIPTIPTIVAWWISTSADKYIIISYLGVAASGLYSVAYKIPSILTMFTGLFNSAWTLSAIQNVEETDNAQFHTNVYKYFNIINVLACSVLIMISKYIAKILFSKDFYVAWKYVPVLLVAYVFSGLAGFLSSSFRATKRTGKLFFSTLIGAILNIILNFYFVRKFGNMGAAITTVIGFAVTFYIRCYDVKKIIDIKIDLIKDSFIYLLLVLQSVITINIKNTHHSILLNIIIVCIICIFYFDEMRNIISIVLTFVKNKIKNEKR